MAKIISIVSGKGGTGKSTLTAYIAKSLALKHKVLAIDLDIGMRSLDILLSVEDKVVFDIGDVLAGRCEVSNALIQIDGYDKFFLLSPPHEVEKSFDLRKLFSIIKEISQYYDYVFIDTPGGAGLSVLAASDLSDLNIVVANTDILSLRDARKMSDLLFVKSKAPSKLILNKLSKKQLIANGIKDIDDIMDFTALPLLGIVSDDDSLKSIKGTKLSKLVTEQINAISLRITGKHVPPVITKL